MSPTPPVPWEKFSDDPRRSQAEGLRASDADRDVAHESLGAAFADGRLDRQEFDERTDLVNGAKTLGALVGPLRDLAPDQAARTVAAPTSSGSTSVGTASAGADAGVEAERRYAAARQNALAVFLAPTLICWAIWLVISLGSGFHYPWPIWVTLGTSFRLIQVLASRGAMIESGRRQIERRERRR